MKRHELIHISKQNSIYMIRFELILTVDYDYPYNDYEVDGEGFGLE